jgi:hypothetical protein
MAANDEQILWNPSAPAQRKKLTRYVLERLDEIAEIFHQAQADLMALTADPAFHGYASPNPQRVRLEVKALYQHLQRWQPRAGGDHLTYVLEPGDSVGGKQRIRLAPEVLHWGHGTCLDWVLLAAACLACARIHPLLLIMEDHAIVGYWVNEETAKSNRKIVLERREIMLHWQARSIQVLNATRIPLAENGSPMSFEDAEHEAKTHLPYVLFGVDIRAAREAGIESLLPSPGSRDDDDIVLQQTEFARHRGFTERPTWTALVEDFLADSQRRAGYLLLIGGAGEGKSAFIADCIKKASEPVFHSGTAIAT